MSRPQLLLIFNSTKTKLILGWWWIKPFWGGTIYLTIVEIYPTGTVNYLMGDSDVDWVLPTTTRSYIKKKIIIILLKSYYGYVVSSKLLDKYSYSSKNFDLTPTQLLLFSTPHVNVKFLEVVTTLGENCCHWTGVSWSLLALVNLAPPPVRSLPPSFLMGWARLHLHNIQLSQCNWLEADRGGKRRRRRRSRRSRRRREE